MQQFYKYFAAALFMLDFNLTLQNYKIILILQNFLGKKCNFSVFFLIFCNIL